METSENVLHSAAAMRRRLGGISRQTQYRLVVSGAIEPVRIGSRLYFEQREIDRFVAARRGRPVAKNDDGPVSARPLVEETVDHGHDSSSA